MSLQGQKPFTEQCFVLDGSFLQSQSEHVPTAMILCSNSTIQNGHMSQAKHKNEILCDFALQLLQTNHKNSCCKHFVKCFIHNIQSFCHADAFHPQTGCSPEGIYILAISFVLVQGTTFHLVWLQTNRIWSLRKLWKVCGKHTESGTRSSYIVTKNINGACLRLLESWTASIRCPGCTTPLGPACPTRGPAFGKNLMDTQYSLKQLCTLCCCC